VKHHPAPTILKHHPAPTILVIAGTRPEVIKLAPVIQAFSAGEEWSLRFAATGQHRELLDQALDQFGLTPDIDLDLMRSGQTSIDFAARALPSIRAAINVAKPDLVIVQGDTNTAVFGALVAFHLEIPVAHVEAGLRSGDLRNPFPEEGNRRIISQLASLHFAPTEGNRRNLVDEGADPDRVPVTGNPVIDVLKEIIRRVRPPDVQRAPRSNAGAKFRILVTLHRRESLGLPLERMCDAIVRLVREEPRAHVVWPVHPNPEVRETVARRCRDVDRLRLVDPVGYEEFVRLMCDTDLVISDSGGVQEEAPTVGTPLLVAREVTERPEVIECGAAKLIGRDPDLLFDTALELMSDSTAYAAMVDKPNPFGDGHAAERIVAATREYMSRV